MSGKRILYISLGILGLGLGALGAVLPLLPAFPFLMLAAFCFGRSSEKLDRWFKGTKLYRNNLETYVKGQGMTWKTKIRVMITVTLLMLLGFFIMFQRALYIPCGVLGAVWLFHILYFCFGVKNYVIKEEPAK
ncbi:MAG TPA: YbaN family protein [Candidatus Galloscillospira stercoripullorum]|nr:YbaN family protein [Candidatus Galloscillospira stercoripullorum]